MSRQKIQMLFSLLFFFFASFLFLSIICSLLISDFDNLLIILFRPNGLFASLTMIVFTISFIVSIYSLASKHDNNRKYNKFIFIGACIFASLIIINILLHSKTEQDVITNTFTQNYYNMVDGTKALLFDSIIFIYFILIPSFNFLYKEKIYKNYFYKIYLKDITPSLNVSVICLFGYAIQIYDNDYYMVEIVLISSFILIFIKIAATSRETITLNLIINMLLLIIGFMIFLLSKPLLLQINLHQASMFFYSIALLFWYLNVSLKLKENY